MKSASVQTLGAGCTYHGEVFEVREYAMCKVILLTSYGVKTKFCLSGSLHFTPYDVK